MENTVYASPTKQFFVSMLTRDIDLKDAILDLLDNCVDGVLRLLENLPEVDDIEQPYLNYWAEITATPHAFTITDNCGGIPRNIAIETAFRLGRLDENRDKDIPTVGMYGIGMKRAIFKMGKSAQVTSTHEGESYFVRIEPEWLSDNSTWDLQLVEMETSPIRSGTRIIIEQLYENISFQFAENSSFLEDLQEEISNFYALIMKKGFKVILNGVEVRPTSLNILVPADLNEGLVNPYAYVGKFDNVNVSLVVGFYRPLATEAEIDKDTVMPRKKDNAGWTIICNDRVVLHKDKSEITGWGSGGVPNYHNQFIAIAGVVTFSSTEPLKLPLNTTKRGLDLQSPVYWHARGFMQDGLKKFTSFTNHWKGREEETNSQFVTSLAKDITETIDTIPEDKWTRTRKNEGKYYSPELPKPPREELKRRIVFSRLIEDIEFLARYYFDDSKVDPSEVGNRSFQDALDRIKQDL